MEGITQGQVQQGYETLQYLVAFWWTGCVRLWLEAAQEIREMYRECIFWEGPMEEDAPHPDHWYDPDRDWGRWHAMLVGMWLSREDPLWSVRWVFRDYSQFYDEDHGYLPIYCRICGTVIVSTSWGDVCEDCADLVTWANDPRNHHW